MPLSSEQQQLVNEVGDPQGTITPLVPVLYGLYDAKGQIRPDLTYLYAKRAALDVRLAEEQPRTDVQLGREVSDAQSARFTHVSTMRDATHAEILRIEGIAQSTRVPVIAALARTAPDQPISPNTPDPNAPRYAGDPLTRLIRW